MRFFPAASLELVLERSEGTGFAALLYYIIIILIRKAVCGESRTHGLEGGKTPRGVYLSLHRKRERFSTSNVAKRFLTSTSA